MEDPARLTNLSCPFVDFEPGPSGLAPIGRAKRGFDDAGALAGLVRVGLLLETAGWRNAGGSR